MGTVQTCGPCSGTGRVSDYDSTGNRITRMCTNCNGTGQVVRK